MCRIYIIYTVDRKEKESPSQIGIAQPIKILKILPSVAFQRAVCVAGHSTVLVTCVRSVCTPLPPTRPRPPSNPFKFDREMVRPAQYRGYKQLKDLAPPTHSHSLLYIHSPSVVKNSPAHLNQGFKKCKPMIFCFLTFFALP